jgi:signal transduction histidine kinase
VARLLANDAALRGVSIRLALNIAPVVVTGDRIQLQQVVLNLVMNAMDAMAEIAPDQRVTLVSTLVTPDGVHLSVRDSGTGLRESDAGASSSPSTRPSRPGWGWAFHRAFDRGGARGPDLGRDNAGPGATFTFSLPLSAAAPPP